MHIVFLIFFRTCLLPIFAAFLISSSSFFSSLSNSLSIKNMSQVHSSFILNIAMICNSEEPSVPFNISGHFPQRLIVCSQLVWDGNKSYSIIAYLIDLCRQDVCKLLVLPKIAPFTVGAFPNSLSIFTSAKKSFPW